MFDIIDPQIYNSILISPISTQSLIHSFFIFYILFLVITIFIDYFQLKHDMFCFQKHALNSLLQMKETSNSFSGFVMHAKEYHRFDSLLYTVLLLWS